jgi:hypothetical protein
MRVNAMTSRYAQATRKAMTLRLTAGEYEALRDRATAERLSMQHVVRRALRAHLDFISHQDKVAEATDKILASHAEALDRLGNDAT